MRSAVHRAPAVVRLYVCRACGIWTLHRRSSCVWCNEERIEPVTYVNAEAEG